MVSRLTTIFVLMFSLDEGNVTGAPRLWPGVLGASRMRRRRRGGSRRRLRRRVRLLRSPRLRDNLQRAFILNRCLDHAALIDWAKHILSSRLRFEGQNARRGRMPFRAGGHSDGARTGTDKGFAPREAPDARPGDIDDVEAAQIRPIHPDDGIQQRRGEGKPFDPGLLVFGDAGRRSSDRLTAGETD